MGLSGVRIVPSAHDARLLCESNHADACLVMLPRALPDEMPRWSADSEAPGRGAGVPSLLIAEVVTPHLARFARNFGYFAAIPASLAPRMLYRCVRAMLQRRRQSIARSTWPRGRPASLALGAFNLRPSETWNGGKPKLQ